MTFLHLGPNWVANDRRFTVQLADAERIVYSDATARAVLRSDVSASEVRVSAGDLVVTADDGVTAPDERSLLGRIVAGLVAMSVPVECAVEDLDLLELVALLFDLESLGPSALVELADALADAASTWTGSVLEIAAGDAAAVSIEAIAVDGEPLVVEVERAVLRSLVGEVAAWALPSDVVTSLELVDAAPGASQSDPAATVVVTLEPLAGRLPTRLLLHDDGDGTLEVAGDSAVLRVGLDPAAALPFLLEAEPVTFDEDGEASHRVTLAVGGVEHTLTGPRSVSELVLAIARGVVTDGALA